MKATRRIRPRLGIRPSCPEAQGASAFRSSVARQISSPRYPMPSMWNGFSFRRPQLPASPPCHAPHRQDIDTFSEAPCLPECSEARSSPARPRLGHPARRSSAACAAAPTSEGIRANTQDRSDCLQLLHKTAEPCLRARRPSLLATRQSIQCRWPSLFQPKEFHWQWQIVPSPRRRRTTRPKMRHAQTINLLSTTRHRNRQA